ncbi:MAG: thioredoxin domain-containing protein, partial [Rhodospirillales bacterium]
VWTEAEIDDVLGKDAPAFKAAYDVTPEGNWEGKTILNRSRDLNLGPEASEKALGKSRDKLLKVRDKRVPPQRDDKVLADWNGLMIAAMAKAGAVFDEPAWVGQAEAVFAFIAENMTADGRLGHTWCAGRLRHPATVDDYANVSRAALVLHGVTGEGGYLDQAVRWLDVVDAHYWDADGQGYFLSADDTKDVIARSKTIHDNAVPSGNGVMAEVLARLFLLTGDPRYRTRADKLFPAIAGKEPAQQVHQPTLLMAFELLETGRQVVIAGDPKDKATAGLRRVVFDAGLVNRVIAQVAPDDVLPEGHPAHGKGPVDGKPAVYVCVGQACGLPLTDADAVRGALARP